VKYFLFIAAIFLLSTKSVADTITLRTDAWCPYSCEPSAEKQGILVDVARKIFEKAGYVVDYRELNWKRAIKEVRQGKYDGLVDAYETDAPDFIFPNEHIAISKMCFFVLSEKEWKYNGLESLRGISLGVINGYSYGENLDRYIETYKKTTSVQVSAGIDVLKRNIKKLNKKRIDAVVEDYAVMGDFVQRNSNYDKLRNAGCLPGEKVYIAFSPAKETSTIYANLIDAGIVEMKKNGELKALFQSYGVTSQSPKD